MSVVMFYSPKVIGVADSFISFTLNRGHNPGKKTCQKVQLLASEKYNQLRREKQPCQQKTAKTTMSTS